MAEASAPVPSEAAERGERRQQPSQPAGGLAR